MEGAFEAIIDELKSFKINPEKLKDEVGQHNAKFNETSEPLRKRIKDLKDKIENIDKKVTRLFTLYEDEIIEKAEFSKRKSTLDDQRRMLEQEHKELNQQLQLTDLKTIDLDSTLLSLQNLADIYDELDRLERRELLRTVMSDIVVGEDSIDYSIYALSPDFVNCDHTHDDTIILITLNPSPLGEGCHEVTG